MIFKSTKRLAACLWRRGACWKSKRVNTSIWDYAQIVKWGDFI